MRAVITGLSSSPIPCPHLLRLARILGERGWQVAGSDQDWQGVELLVVGVGDGDTAAAVDALRRRHAPRLVLAPADGPAARARVLALGVDEAMDRSAPAELLVARVVALLRLRPGDVLGRYRVGDLQIDLTSRHVRRGGAHVTLSQREYQLLVLLARQGGCAVARSTIIDKLWPGDLGIGDNAVDALASRLRRKIDGAGGERLIHTVRGVGYRLGDGDDASFRHAA